MSSLNDFFKVKSFLQPAAFMRDQLLLWRIYTVLLHSTVYVVSIPVLGYTADRYRTGTGKPLMTLYIVPVR